MRLVKSKAADDGWSLDARYRQLHGAWKMALIKKV